MIHEKTVFFRFFGISIASALVLFMASTFLFQTWRANVRLIVLSVSDSNENASVAANNIETLLKSHTFSESVKDIQDSALSDVNVCLENENGSVVSISANIKDASRIASVFGEVLARAVEVSKTYYGTQSGIEIRRFEKITYKRSLQYPISGMAVSVGFGLLIAFVMEKKVFFDAGRISGRPTYFMPSLQNSDRRRSALFSHSLARSGDVPAYSDDVVSNDRNFADNRHDMLSRKADTNNKTIKPPVSIEMVSKPEDAASAPEASLNSTDEVLQDRVASVAPDFSQETRVQPSSSQKKVFESARTVSAVPSNLPVGSDIPDYIQDLISDEKKADSSEQEKEALLKKKVSNDIALDQSNQQAITFVPARSVAASSSAGHAEASLEDNNEEPTEEELKERLNKLLRGELS